MNEQQNTRRTTISRAGAIALAALASLSVAAGCGGGEEAQPAEQEVTIQQELKDAGFAFVDEYDVSGLKLPGAPLPEEGYMAYDPDDDEIFASVLVFASHADAERRLEADGEDQSSEVREDGTLITVTDGGRETPRSDAFLDEVSSAVSE